MPHHDGGPIWQPYTVVWRLLAPLRVGRRTIGNLQQTRPYVPGWVLWAALTARLTRDAGRGASGTAYREIGAQLKACFRFGYAWPTTRPPHPRYPWEDRARFDADFLDAYMSTALDYDDLAAEEGSLHEAEFLRPYTPQGQPVYLVASLWVREPLPEPLRPWQQTLDRVLLGGERRYGWGRVRLKALQPGAQALNIADPEDFTWQGPAPAHVVAVPLLWERLRGPVEPLVGWQTRPDGRKGLPLEPNFAFRPGVRVPPDIRFRMDAWGIWHPLGGG